MLAHLKQRLTYANVTATLALFIALGGSSYAALTLPRNSVGAAQIRTGAVGSGELRDRSVLLNDINRGARKALRGSTGPAGPAGPAGQAAAKYFAAATAAGRFLRGNATSGGHGPSAGIYTIAFAQPVSSCVITASLGSTDATPVPAGRITTNETNGQIEVRTYDAAGAPFDIPFQLIATC